MHIISLDDGQVLDLDTRAGAYFYVGTFCAKQGADPRVLSALELLLDAKAPLGELPPAKAKPGAGAQSVKMAGGEWISDDAILAVCDAAGFTSRQKGELATVIWKDGIDVEAPTSALRRFVEMLLSLAGAASSNAPAEEPVSRIRAAEPGPSGIEAMVCADIARRQQLGIAKYGQTVADNPLSLRQWLQHAYEETLDSAVYLRRAVAEIENTEGQTRGVSRVV